MEMAPGLPPSALSVAVSHSSAEAAGWEISLGWTCSCDSQCVSAGSHLNTGVSVALKAFFVGVLSSDDEFMLNVGNCLL